MALRLVQLRTQEGSRAVAVLVSNTKAQLVEGIGSCYELASLAISKNTSLESVVAKSGLGEIVDIRAAVAEARLLAPLDHPHDPAHTLVSGTGLTHLGSAQGRDSMHRGLDSPGASDSMKMFELGLKGGRPPPGQVGAQPEWFYKGDGSCVVAPEAELTSPNFAEDGGEEPEIVGLYLIGPNGDPYRVGFALGNEFSDHIVEKFNYLWLAHSKLRPCSFGPELLTGPLPAKISGRSRILRGNQVIFDKPFWSGEENMSHSIANLEMHHFKYGGFRRPGDVHVHFFGTATLSFSDGLKTQSGDVFEIEADGFMLPLRNRLAIGPTTNLQMHTI